LNEYNIIYLRNLGTFPYIYKKAFSVSREGHDGISGDNGRFLFIVDVDLLSYSNTAV
jgi:hypothetical protein